MIHVLDHFAQLFVVHLLVHVVDFVRHLFVEREDARRRFDYFAVVRSLLDGRFDRRLPFDAAVFGCHACFVARTETPAGTLRVRLDRRHIVDAEHHVLRRIDDRIAVSGIEQVACRKTKEEDINIPLEIKSLPVVKAFGNLNSLQVAASENEKLATMINLYLMLNPEDRKKHINDIVYEWAGVNNMDPNSRTTSIDSRMVNVYEKITGKPFTWRGNFNDANIRISANIIKERFDIFKHYVYATIKLQTTYTNIDLDTETMSLENNVKPSYKFDALNSKLTQLYKDNRHDEIKNLMDVVREASAYKPVFQENLKSNLLNFFGSDYKFLSLCLNTYIQGTDNNEVLNGSFENNFIVGGKGNDILYGGGGNDTYIFYKGDGKDTIYDTAGNDKIEFKEGITPSRSGPTA